MQTKNQWMAAVVCAFVLFLCPVMFGQANGSISGTVADKTGSVISGASVKITSQGTGVVRDTTTDGSGHYLVTLLPVTIYTIHLESKGFRAVEQKDVKLQVDDHLELNFTLQPASVTESVEVTANEVSVQTSNPTLGQVITSQQVSELPLNGRDFVQLATLTPGTTQETNPNSFFNGGPSSEVSARGSYSLSVGGSRASSTDWLLDGNDNNELTAGGISILPSIDAIQEFKVLTFNYSAEYGTRAGPTVLVSTKSGANQLHGSLFEFFRNTKLDARSYFAKGPEKFNLNQYGGSLGGAIVKDKTFFFIDYQGKNQRRGIPFVGIVPTAAQRTGDFTNNFLGQPQAGQVLFNPYSVYTDSTGAIKRRAFQCDSSGTPLPAGADGVQALGADCNKIPTGLINPIATQLAAFYPASNLTGDPNNNYANNPVRKLDEKEFDVRLDHNFSVRDSLFARFSYDQAVSFIPGGSPGFAEANAFGSTQNIDNHGRNIAISETHVFSDRNLNQFNAGYNRIFNYINSFGSGTCISQKLGIPGANLGGISCGLVSTQVGGGYWSLGDRGFAPLQGGTNVFSVSDSFDMIRGKHDIRIGGQVRANQLNVKTNAFQDGFWVFTNAWTSQIGAIGPNFYASGFGGGDNFANLLLGIPDLALHDQTFQGATTGRRWKLFRPYVQDNWRVTPDLTLNLGLAWAIVTPITEAHNRQSNFDLATSTFLIPGKNSDGRVGVKLDKTAFEPRIGFAWKPFGSQKTAVRGGYAIFHDSSWNQGAQGLWENPPFFAESGYAAFFPDVCPFATAQCASQFTPTGKSISDGFPILTQPTNPATFGGNIQQQNRNFHQGRVQQYNFNVERQLPGDVVFTAGYAGSRSSHILIDGVNLNVVSPGGCATNTSLLGCGLSTTTVPYPQFGTVGNNQDIGVAHYDSLQVKAETKNPRYGLYALIGYTYARAFDNGFSDGVGTTTGATYYPLPGTKHADWALSQIQLNHNFTASMIYDLPFGKGKRFGNGWNPAVNGAFGGWEVNLIEKFTTGFPIFIFASLNQSGVPFSNNGNNFTRPNQICNGKSSNPSVSAFFKTSCFVDAPAGTLGNANRAPLYGPRFANTDLSLIKHLPLPWRDGMRLDFRAEFFNLFNHPQFALPNADVDSPATFGVTQQTVNNPRLVQFALKLNF